MEDSHYPLLQLMHIYSNCRRSLKCAHRVLRMRRLISTFFCQHPILLFYMRHISISVGKNMFQRKKSTSPHTLIFHYHLNLVLKCCHCIATVLCFVYLVILYCTVLYLYLFICSWAIMALCINKVSYHEK